MHTVEVREWNPRCIQEKSGSGILGSCNWNLRPWDENKTINFIVSRQLYENQILFL